jgi:hypothetical protein
MPLWWPGEQQRWEDWHASRAQRIAYRSAAELAMLPVDPSLRDALALNFDALFSPTHWWRQEEEPEFEDSLVIKNQNLY